MNAIPIQQISYLFLIGGNLWVMHLVTPNWVGCPPLEQLPMLPLKAASTAKQQGSDKRRKLVVQTTYMTYHTPVSTSRQCNNNHVICIKPGLKLCCIVMMLRKYIFWKIKFNHNAVLQKHAVGTTGWLQKENISCVNEAMTYLARWCITWHICPVACSLLLWCAAA